MRRLEPGRIVLMVAPALAPHPTDRHCSKVGMPLVTCRYLTETWREYLKLQAHPAAKIQKRARKADVCNAWRSSGHGGSYDVKKRKKVRETETTTHVAYRLRALKKSNIRLDVVES
ncbi:hypothetical protein GX51_06527 [Blastomyces parvus]|uniref:Uncharacterized protein n=1 Tax=Blastomyces parvus TaxID=2060905 RepID=A0A2B7WQM2_9EURO|nr:hypothetical protein GX51_06527 [Blastomyces parvus]